MATYPIPVFNRFLLSSDTVLWSVASHTSALARTPLTTAQLDQLDGEAYSGTVPMDAGGGFSVFFTEPVNVQAYLLSLTSGNAPSVAITRDPIPDLSAGTWITMGTATTTPVASYRQPFSVLPVYGGITGLRFDFTNAAQLGNFHLYGEPVTAPGYLLMEDGGDPRASGSYLDFGTGGKDGWEDIRFRFLNNDPTQTTISAQFRVLADTVSGTSLLDELFFSADGTTFVSLRRDSTFVTESLPVGALSKVYTLRRYSPANHDNSRGYAVALSFAPTAVSGKSFSARFYVGDVDTARPGPQLWDSSRSTVRPGDQFTVRAAGVGNSATEFTAGFSLYTPQKPSQLLEVVDWTTVAANSALGQDAALVDLIDHSADLYEPAHQLVTLRVPDTLEGGSYLLQIITGGAWGQTASNSRALRVLPTPPQVQSGFRLRAVGLNGEVLEDNIPFQSLDFTVELSDVGSGKVTLDFTNDFWTKSPGPFTPRFVAENEFYWVVYEEDQLRAKFLNSIAKDTVVSTDLTRKIEIEAEGNGKILSWSMVAPPRFPKVPPFYWTFAHARMWQWLMIWAQCVKRSPANAPQRRFRPTFTRYTDSKGNAWLDKGFENQQHNGVDMLTLLREHCDAVGADFRINPDDTIDVAYARSTVATKGRYFGTDQQDVVFSSALVTMRKLNHDRSEVANWVIAQDDYGEVTLAFDEPSIVRNGLREKYVEGGRSGKASRRLAKAKEILSQQAADIVSWDLGVDPYYVDRDGNYVNRAFVDYEVGDWIYLRQEETGELVAVQVHAITMSIDSQGRVRVELTLESLNALRRRKDELRDAVTSGGGSGSGGGLLVLFEEEIFPIVSANPRTTYDIRYLPLPKSEIITVGMRKYMEIDGSGSLAVREFTRTLRRGEHWERTGWTVTITDPTVFDEAF